MQVAGMGFIPTREFLSSTDKEKKGMKSSSK